MQSDWCGLVGPIGMLDVLGGWLVNGYLLLQVLIGFSIIIFVHELGHFLAAKAMGVRVERFAVGFFYRICGYRRGEGFTFGKRPELTPPELAAKGYGETDYCLNVLPFGGYVKMLGEGDIEVNEETGEIKTTDDPRSFTNKPVWRRMIVVSAGVVFNLLFAVLLFFLVFLSLGKTVDSPVIGFVEPVSPAASAGLQPGDRVLEIDGNSVHSFEDIVTGWVLGGDRLRFKIERDGKVLDQDRILVIGRRDGQRELPGVHSMEIPVVGGEAADGPPLPPETLRPGDRITRVAGRPVRTTVDITTAFRASHGRPVMMTIERPATEASGAAEQLEIPLRPELRLVNSDSDGPGRGTVDSGNLLGFRLRPLVLAVDPGSPAAEAGFRAGDVIVQWDTVPDPVYTEILASIHANNGEAVSVIVERAGESAPLQVIPRRPFQFRGEAKPRVGITFGTDNGAPVVADLAPGTPAAELGLPRGARLLAIDGEPAASWSDVNERLRAAAGRTVEIRYRAGADEAVGRLAVPSSVVNELDLPPTAVITRIGGADDALLESGRQVQLPSPTAVRALLEKHIGEAVAVEYRPTLAESPREATFNVRADNVDPWQLRVLYTEPALSLSPLKERFCAAGPAEAVTMALGRAGEELSRVYRIVKAMAENLVSRDRGLSVKNVAGPIGIVTHTLREAELGFGDLLFFLAYISVQLAVLNFLPLPVVDGGLMVFLLLEKLRGKPLSLKVQVITTLTGLGLIVVVFLLVTVQDITRLLGVS